MADRITSARKNSNERSLLDDIEDEIQERRSDIISRFQQSGSGEKLASQVDQKGPENNLELSARRSRGGSKKIADG